MTNHSPTITLNRSALHSNIAHAKATLAPDASLMIAVKSNAYGHSAELVVPEAIRAGADELAVLDVETGIAIKHYASHTPVFAWLLGPDDDYQGAVEAGVELGVSCTWQLDAIAQTTSEKPCTVHLKIDTGLHRNGATIAQWPDLIRSAVNLQDSGKIRVRAIWSHLADTSVEESRLALSRLHDAIETAKTLGINAPIAHIAASHAAVELPEARLDMVRLGILAYGISPFDDHSAEDLGYHPVLALHAPVISSGEDGVELGIGFAHGLLQPSDEAKLTAGDTVFRVGSVAAETTTVFPVNSGHSLQVGDQVTVISTEHGGPRVEQWASWCNTIGDEIVAKLHPDIPRVWV